MTRTKSDPDIDALKKCVAALNKSSSQVMLRANLEFLNDRFLNHPSDQLPDHLKTQIQEAKP